MPAVETLLLLGEAHTTYGEIACRATEGERSAVAITAGATADTPSSAFKRDKNEDAALVQDDGRLCLLAVADGHHGRYASHYLLEGLAGREPPDLATLLQPPALLDVLAALGDPEGHPDEGSGTTLLVVVYDRERREGCGVSFGDSSFVVLDPEAGARTLTEKTPRYVSPARPRTLAAHGAVRFTFSPGPGQLLLAFTDGVDECHYTCPETSIRREHLERLFAEVGPRAEDYARRLLELALAGVDGNPGGEDNAAVAVAEA